MMGALINLAEVKRRKMIAQYLAFYGNVNDSQREETKWIFDKKCDVRKEVKKWFQKLKKQK